MRTAKRLVQALLARFARRFDSPARSPPQVAARSRRRGSEWAVSSSGSVEPCSCAGCAGLWSGSFGWSVFAGVGCSVRRTHGPPEGPPRLGQLRVCRLSAKTRHEQSGLRCLPRPAAARVLRTGSRGDGSWLGSPASACPVSQHPVVTGLGAEPAPPEAGPQARVGMPSGLFASRGISCESPGLSRPTPSPGGSSAGTAAVPRSPGSSSPERTGARPSPVLLVCSSRSPSPSPA